MWIKKQGIPNRTIKDFAEGDLINYWLDKKKYIGEVVTIQNTLNVHFLEQHGKIWVFNEDITHSVHPKHVYRHLTRMGKTLTGTLVRNMWNQMGYEVGVHEYCLLKDVDSVALDIPEYETESDDEEEDMSDFIIPDEQGEAFTHPNPSQLNDEEKQWVFETHKAVNDWNKWNPTDKKEKAIKSFVDALALKYCRKEDERQFTHGASLEYNNPPTKTYN